MVRELLAGHRECGRHAWPDSVRAALTSTAFAAELRDLLLRAAERGVGPGRLAEWGRRRKRPEWLAAARFAREYQDVADLRQGTQRFRCRAGSGGTDHGRARRAGRRSGAVRRTGAAPADLRGRVPGRRSRPGAAGRAAGFRGRRAVGLRRSGPGHLRLPRGRSAGPAGLLGATATVHLTASHRLSPELRRRDPPASPDCCPAPGATGSLTSADRARRHGTDGRPGGQPAQRWSVRCRPPPRRRLSSPTSSAVRTCSTACRGRGWRCCPRSPGRYDAGADPGLPGRRGAGDRRLGWRPCSDASSRSSGLLLTVLRCGYRPDVSRR